MYLKTRVSGNIPDLILSELEKHCLVRSEHLLGEADVSAEEVDREAKQLVSDDRLGRFREFVYHSDRLDSVASQLKERISAEFADNPHIKGLSLDRIQSLTTLPADTLMGVVQFMMDRGMLVRTNELLDLAGRSLTLKGLIKQAYEEIMHDLKANPFAPTSLSQLAGRGKNHQQAIKYIIDSGEGYKCGADFIFLLDVWNETVRFIRDRLDQSGSLAVSELRERFGYTRKYAIPILEETDRLGITRREGDVRVRGEV